MSGHWFARLVEAVWDYAGPRLLGTLTHVATDQPLIALTFDDGPHPDSTPALLDLLERYEARATFFMLGEPAQRFPEIVRRAAEAGHALGVHGWDHPAFPLLTSAQRRQQIQRCAKVLAPYGQRLFRPPYGYQSFASRLDAWRLGYRVVGWSVAGHDWLNYTADQIVEMIAPQLQPGAIILLHDVLYHTVETHYADRRPMLAAVETLLTQFGSQFQFVTVPELRRWGRAQQSNWYRPPDAQWLNGLHGQFGPPHRYATATRMNTP